MTAPSTVDALPVLATARLRVVHVRPGDEAETVAVFTRTDSLVDRNAPLDAAIGQAAAIAVGALR